MYNLIYAMIKGINNICVYTIFFIFVLILLLSSMIYEGVDNMFNFFETHMFLIVLILIAIIFGIILS